MSFVLTVVVKGHREDQRVAFNQRLTRGVETHTNWSAIVIYRMHHNE